MRFIDGTLCRLRWLRKRPFGLWIYLLTNRCFFAILHTVLARGRPMPLDRLKLREFVTLLSGADAATAVEGWPRAAMQ